MLSFNQLKTQATSYLKGSSGNVAIMLALGLMAVVATAGAAIDYVAATAYWSSANSAADSAVLAAVNAGGRALQNGSGNWKAVAVKAGNFALKQNMEQFPNAAVNNIRFDLKKNGHSLAGTLTFEAAYGTAFMRLMGIRNLDRQVSVAAQNAMSSYIDVHFLVDNSSSMGIGATANDQTIMQNAVGCTVGCHIAISWGLPSNYNQVRATHATLRIDVVREAIRKFLQDTLAGGYKADQVRVSIDLMGNDITPLVAASTNINAALNQLDQIDLNQIYRGTNIAYSVQQLANKLGHGGDGSSPSNRMSFVVLASDGIENSTDGHITSPGVLDTLFRDPNFADTGPQTRVTADETVQTIEGNACDPLKTLGHSVLVAHIQYLVPSVGGADARYTFIKNQLLDKSEKSLSDCASSPDFAFMAKDSSEIEPVFDKIRQAIDRSTNLRLTQ